MADSYWVNPTISSILSISILGVDILGYTNAIRIFETVCKPYITGQLTVIDTNNLIDNLNLQGGERVEGAFSSPPNNEGGQRDGVYSFDCLILSVKGHPTPNTQWSITYTIDIIGPVYYQDRASIVQEAYKGITATGAISNLWGKYLNADSLSIDSTSIGMLGDKQGYTVNNKKPLTAINDILKAALFPSMDGNALIFRDRSQVRLATLTDLFASMGSQEYFIQKTTWAMQMDPKEIYHAIIYAAADTSRSKGGRAGMAEVAAAANQGRVVFDHHNAELKITDAAGIGGMISSGISAIQGFLGTGGGGNLGGMPNVLNNNTQLWPNATAPFNKVMSEKMTAAQARGNPQLQLKVPLQTGINVTVGKGITVYLMPPSDQSIDPSTLTTGGGYLVTDLTHELVVDGESGQVIGTTTMQAMKPGFNK